MKKRQPSHRLEGNEALYYICGDYALCVNIVGHAEVRRIRTKVTPNGDVRYFRFWGELVEVDG